jgi:predicted neutral ceramidase superfamily lipid hydrolase
VLVSNESMNDYIEKAVRRYSSLFTLPSHSKLLLLLFAVCLLNGVVVVATLHPLSYISMAEGLTLGATLFVLIMATDFIIHFTSFQGDLIFNLRRCSALSMYSATFWLLFILLGAVINTFIVGIWFKLFLLGFCVVLALRLLVLWAVSFAGVEKSSIYATLLPVLCTMPVVFTASLMGEKVLDASVVVFFSLALAVTLSAVFLFFYLVNRVGVRILDVGSFSILKAFLANWNEDLNEPLEQFFERFGVKRDIKVSALAFRASGKIKALMVVPAFHPGPFKNVGSSNLPHTIQASLENKLPRCVVAVPHGLSGHDLDLASQAQNQLVLDSVEKMMDFSGFSSVASSSVRVKKNGASASCQTFNKCALITLTLAPKTMEDLPSDLDSFIVSEAQKHGLSTAICVDAHNSIQGPFNISAAINPLKEAVAICLEKVANQKSESFDVGTAKVVPKEFGLREGMGPGGIVVTAIKTGNQTTAYVTIDGNNMISGLREKILLALSEVGINDGEVFTTDTHAVNAVILNTRGYHPIGEAMDQETLIKYIKQAATNALANLEPAEASWRTENVLGVRVIGEKQVEAMCMLADKAIQRAKRLAVSIFPLAGLVLAALLLLL